MYPILFQAGDLVIANFGIFLTLAYFVFIITVAKYAEVRHVNLGFFMKHLTLLSVLTYLGVKFLYWASNAPRIYSDILDNLGRPLGVFKLLFNMDEFFVLGGILLFSISFTYLIKKYREPLYAWYDVMITALSLALVPGFVGSFLGGFYVGSETLSIFGVTYSAADISYSLAAQIASSVPVHPIQLYASVISLGIFFVCMKLMKRIQTPGLVGVIGTILLSTQILLVEFFRSHADRMVFFGPFSLNQIFALLFIVLAVFIFMKKLPRISS